MSRLAPTLLLVALTACAHHQHAPPAPAPAAAEAPLPQPPPRVSMALGESGVTYAIDEGDPDRCVRLADRAICGAGSLAPSDLGAQLLEAGWVLPASALRIPDAEVTLEVAEGIEPLGPLSGPPVAYLEPGIHTHRLREVGWIERPPLEPVGLEDTRLATYERAAVAIGAWLGEARHRILLSNGDAALPGMVHAAPGASPTAAVIHGWLAAEPDWWAAGVGDYLAMLVDHQAGELSSDAAYDELLLRYARHRDAPGESPASAEGQVAADVGALVAFCVDVELRTRETSLPEELARLTEGPLQPTAFRTRVAREHPEIAQRHHDRSRRRGVIDLDSCLRRAGRRLIAHEVPVVDPARLLRVGALDDATAQVERGGSGPLRSGDVIRNVRGRAVRRAWDIVFYLRDLGGRHRFSVSVQRGERTVRTWLRMVALDDDLPTRIRFTATEDEAADPEGDPFGPPTDDRR